MSKQQKRETERKSRILSRASRFVEKAERLGLDEESWAVYAVDIQEPVSFFEMEQMIKQCTNSSTYYFKPISLHAKTTLGSVVKEEKKVEQKSSPSTSAVAQRPEEGDVMLTLRGAFVVRQK